MPECPTCGKRLDPTARYCPEDGTPVTATAPQPAAEQRPPGRTLELPLLLGNRYRLLEVRGGGGMAQVYRALDTTLEREVAVKLINPELREDPEFDTRFQREARIASQLSDPHIVVVHDFAIDPAHGPYLVMEYLHGQSLREYLQARGPLPLRAALQLAGQLLLALIHAHGKGIVHRDIKPDNLLLLNQSGVHLHIRVLDFGIARMYRGDAPAESTTLTRPGAVLGTPRYMAPEQLAGQPADVRSDLYSAALVIYEALTGTLPYVNPRPLTELCPEVPLALAEVLDRCLQPNREDRPASALQVYLRLQEAGKASGVLLLPPEAMTRLIDPAGASPSTRAYNPPASRPFWRRRPLAVAAVLVVLLALGAWAGVAAWSRWTSGAPADRESLLGLEIGSTRDDAVLKLGKPQQEEPGSSLLEAIRQHEGDILPPGALAREGADLEGLWWRRKQVGVLLHDNAVRVVLVRAPFRGASGRGVHVGDSEARLIHLYSGFVALEVPHRPGPASAATRGSPGRGTGKIYRYDDQGIAYEVENERVRAIALYPPKP